MVGFPLARTDGVICEPLDDELLIYDTVSNSAHALRAVAASIWRRCDGRRSTQEIADQLGIDLARVTQGLGELDDAGLLEGVIGPQAGVSRREAAKRFGRFGAVALTAPLIVSVAVPTAAAANSASCTTSAECATSNACLVNARCNFDTGRCEYDDYQCPPPTNPCQVTRCVSVNSVATCETEPYLCPGGTVCILEAGNPVCVAS